MEKEYCVMAFFCGKRLLMCAYWNDYSFIVTTITYVLTIYCCCCASEWAGCALRSCSSSSCSSLVIAYSTNTFTICCIHFKAVINTNCKDNKCVQFYFILLSMDKLLFSMQLYIVHSVGFTRWTLSIINNCNKCVIKWKKNIVWWHFSVERKY